MRVLPLGCMIRHMIYVCYGNKGIVNYNIRRTKSQHLNDSHLVLQLSLSNPLKPSVKSIMQM